MLHSLVVILVALAFLYLMCFSLVFAFFSVRAGIGWPFRKDYYSDLQDLPYRQIFFYGTSLFILSLVLYLVISLALA
jgi:vancomycin permeability regulator SanA